MAKLMVHRDILKNFSKLPSKVQKRVHALIDEFQTDPHSPAIGLHALPGTMLDDKVRGVRKFPDGYRAIVIAPEQGDTYLLVHIDAHDKAYDWAKRKRFEVHEMTGVFQVFDAELVGTAAEKVNEAEPAPPKSSYPLADLPDDDLFTAGVPKPLIPAVKSITSDSGLEALSSYLPPDCRDVLFGIAAGMTLDEALQEMLFASEAATATAKPASSGDFSHISESPNFDLVLVENQEELKSILAASIEDWRVFLHPYQKKLVNWKTKGPMKITGAAGTGKTVALIHRAISLAKHLKTEGEKVLITTFTTNLSYSIRSAVRQLDEKLAERIDVTNLHTLSRTICSRAGWKGRIANKEDIEQVWDEVWSAPLGELPLPRDEMQREYELVIEQNGIDNLDDYLTTVRSARPRMTRKDRKAAWPVFQAFSRGLKKRQQLLTYEGAIHEARMAVEQGSFPKYRYVLVDEVQDFSLEALRLIRSLSPIEEESEDPLCLVGDGHQRVYGTNVPMSRAGINVVGRSRRLKINYRTSEQIRIFAQSVLDGVEADDLDGGVTSTVGDHSLFQGPQPWLEKYGSEKEEAEAIVAWIQMLMADPNLKLKSHEVCITPYKPLIVSALTTAGIDTLEIEAREEDPGEKEPGVRLASMQRIKGLEFRAVAMCCSDKSDPMNDLSIASIKDRCERYVAATRARERLFVSLASE